MELNKIEKNNELNLNNIELDEKTQKNFLETTIGKTINTAIDIGIRALFPDFLEDQIINIKDNLINHGLKEGIQKTIEDTIEIGKSAIGIFTGNFENISQMQNAVQTGGLIDGMSSLIDFVVDKTKKAGLLDSNITKGIKQGKNIILNNIQSNIEKTFSNQLISIENLNKYIEEWDKSFKNKDFYNMEKAYENIEKNLKEIIPLESTLTKARMIENLHSLVKNNGQDFNLSKEQLELAEKL